MEKFYVIDGHALCYRAYYAFINNPLMNSKGQNTSAIFGFARMLFKLIEDQKPDYLAVAFDPPVKTFRFEMYKEYKANRQKTPDDLKSQIEEIKNMVQQLDIPVIINNNVEADDVLGTIAKDYASPEINVYLVTGDKDAYQLVNENVKIYANTKGISEHVLYDDQAVKEKLGVTPEQIIDYMALVGDSADNIPGVRGIGPKGAEKLISEYGSIDKIYENIDQIKGANQKKLLENKELAYLSKELVTIKTDVDLEFDIQKAAFTSIDNSNAYDYFTNIEMKTIAEEYFSSATNVEIKKQLEVKKEYICITTADALNDAFTQIQKSKIISIDTETTSVNANEAELVGVSVSIKENHGWYFPVKMNSLFDNNEIEFSKQDLLSKLKDVLENEKTKKIGQNIKYDYIIFKREGVEIKNIYFDTMVASYVIDPSVRRHNMDDLAETYLNYKTIKYSDLVGKGKNQMQISEVPLDDVTEYACEDTDVTLQLYNVLKNKLKENDVEDLYYKIEMPLVRVLAEIEMYGVKIDQNYFKKLSIENGEKLTVVESKIHELSGENFNINSTKELSRILFEKLDLKPVRKTKTGFSTDITVLEALKKDHEIISYLIEYRTLSKLKSTYIDSLPKLINSNTGRLHTSYNQTVAATGRLSSTDPNLQNIPIKDDFGKQIRKGFVPENDFELLSVDYSQIELRLAAHLSGDENMKKAFNEDIDIHSMTASSVFGVDIENVDSHQRRQAKIINFATIYGVSPYGLSQQAEISMSDAKIFIDKYFETYPKFREYIDKTIEFARENKYVETLCGRKRPILEIDAKVSFRREGAERIAINTPIQGTSADMIKIAMIDIFNYFEENNFKSKMIMQVHDELVFEVHKDEKDIVQKIVEEKMIKSLKLDVVIKVESGWGKNWQEAH